ncbi:MAG: phosphate ABC transporter substrate-binding protein [Candidatus Eisenbacteria bacterium]|nr:phosphate ABC transporter substrate-binding protein [Candidatus Eisenbacteria bacterium]
MAVSFVVGSAGLASATGGSGTYQKVSGVSGTLNFIGSDTMNNLMTLWGEAFQQVYPSVKVQGEGKGSSTAPPALIAGTAQLGPMSRPMKSSELDEFEKKFGYKPLEIKVALDALAVFVQKDNPVKQLTLQQVDAIFSKTRKGGHATDITTWGEAGATGALASKPISLFGRNSASGTYGYFKEHALWKGDFKDTVKEQPGSASVVQGVEKDPTAIGYSGMGYVTTGAHAIAIAAADGKPFVDPKLENVLSGEYPLSRFLYVYVNRTPGKPMDPLVKEFLAFVLSQGGQAQTEKDGFIAVPETIAKTELAKLQ